MQRIVHKYDRINQLYTNSTTIHFEKLHDTSVNQIIAKIKELKKVIYFNHQDDVILQEQINAYVSIIRKILSTLEKYEIYLAKHFEELSSLLESIYSVGNQQYLVEEYAKPIFEYAKQLYKRKGNYYIEKIEELIKKYSPNDVCIITREKGISTIEIGTNKIDVHHYKSSDLRMLNKDVFIFIGSPELFGEKFRTVFLANHYIFIAFDVFNNKFNKVKGLAQKKQQVFTVYDEVKVRRGFIGEQTLEVLESVDDKDVITEVIESKIANLESQETILKFKSKLVRFANNSWMLVPIEHDVLCIDLEDHHIHKVAGNKLQIGEFVIFRSQNEQGIIREVADEILGKNSVKLRNGLEKWKHRLQHNVNLKGYDRLSRILKNKGVSSASPQNIKNWISPYSIEPRCLDELLIALKFEETVMRMFVEQAKMINSAHKLAGREIKKTLMQELKSSKELLGNIQEKGFYKFESIAFKGASFNIEEIRFISEKEYEVPLSETMILFKRRK